MLKSTTGNESFIIVTRRFTVVEPLLSGIVLGLIFVTLSGLFYAAYRQYKRPNELGG
nr:MULTISPECIES: cytochrome b6-f complex subunit PetG [unclassified Anabaena]